MPIFAISTLYLLFSWHLESLSDIFGIEACIFYLMYNRIKKNNFLPLFSEIIIIFANTIKQIKSIYNSKFIMKKEDKEFLKQVEKLVYEQMKTKHVNCDTVCESMNITNQHLRRKILAITGKTGGKYILTIRMKYAKELLAKGKYSVGAVALKCGYDDANNFSRTFKREVGKKPTEYAASVK